MRQAKDPGEGVRIEELLEITHHSLIRYRLPTTGELVPLLQIAPSKTDTERLLVVSPELADVLSATINRVRDAVYPDEAIQAHLAFLARRRALRPTEEYRVPTDEEWDEFLGHPRTPQARPRRLRPRLGNKLPP